MLNALPFFFFLSTLNLYLSLSFFPSPPLPLTPPNPTIGRTNEMASTTNKDKAKLKNPLMRMHARERREKRNLSLSDRQVRGVNGASGRRSHAEQRWLPRRPTNARCSFPPFFFAPQRAAQKSREKDRRGRK